MKHHSPIVVGLLLAAMLAVDAVAIVWLSQDPGFALAAILYDALVSAQLGVVCLWAISSARDSVRASLGTIAAVLAASVPSAYLRWLSFGEACGIYGGFVVMLIAVLWGLKRTKFWQRLTGIPPTVWQFSLAHLLAAMTVVAVLITLMRRSEFVAADSELWRFLTVLTLSDALVVVATTVAWAAPWHWLPRLAVACAVTGFLGALNALGIAKGLMGHELAKYFALDEKAMDLVAYAVIMCIVIFTWLELAPILPHARRAASLPPAGADASSHDRGA
jgi:hypothetical protein